jgi:hypothetical protein
MSQHHNWIKHEAKLLSIQFINIDLPIQRFWWIVSLTNVSNIGCSSEPYLITGFILTLYYVDVHLWEVKVTSISSNSRIPTVTCFQQLTLHCWNALLQQLIEILTTFTFFKKWGPLRLPQLKHYFAFWN